MGKSIILSLRDVGKHYGSVVALQQVNLDIAKGEVVAICGNNGAGKSSLVKIISGAERPSFGSLFFCGKEVQFSTPRDALESGIATIYQDLALAPRLSIAANVFMGSELTRSIGVPFLHFLDKQRMAVEARQYLAQLSVPLNDMSIPVEQLSGGQRQAVAISRALRWRAQIIVMDEPTAALGVKESIAVLGLIRKLKENGHTVILVSHNMREVVALADRVVIMEGGCKRQDRLLNGLDAEALAQLIVSRSE
ncbi:sugar ABC transporter ATP-binding protein [Hydrogenophaga soli]